MQSYDSFDDEYIMDDEYDMTDEEIEEAFDSLIECCKESAGMFAGDYISVTDPAKAEAIRSAYELLKRLMKGTSAEVTLALNSPFKSMAYIRITGDNLIFKNPKLIAAVSKMASNINIYPKVDGTAQFDFTFNGITETIEVEEEI